MLFRSGGLQSMGRKELDTTERFHFHFPLSCIGEGDGNPLQCSCLENPRDGGAWGAAVCGVAESDATEATQQRLYSSPHSKCTESVHPIVAGCWCCLQLFAVKNIIRMYLLYELDGD